MHVNIYIHNLSLKNRKISVQGTEVVLFSEKNEEYISLTDMAKFKNPKTTGLVISHWMSTRFTVEFLGIWERVNNPDFNYGEFATICGQSGLNNYKVSVKEWISAEFKIYLIKEFQRLKQEEGERKDLDWDVKRMLTKINYRIHTDAVKEQLVFPPKLTGRDASFVSATEADLLNKALFGKTSQEWKRAQPSLQGNMREYATVQMTSLIGSPSMKKLEHMKP